MSNEASGVTSASSSGEAQATGETTGATSTTGAKPAATSSTMISSMEQMRTQYPDLYNKVLVSMAQNMCIQMRRGNDRLIQKMKELRRG